MMTHQTAAALALLVTLGTAARHARAEQVPLGDFVRVYDKAHLAAHPDQLVREMRLTNLIFSSS